MTTERQALQLIRDLHGDSKIADGAPIPRDSWVCMECGKPDPCQSWVLATNALAAGDPS